MKRSIEVLGVLLAASALAACGQDASGAGGHHSSSGKGSSGAGASGGGDVGPGGGSAEGGAGVGGQGGTPPESCDPYQPRAAAPQLIIGPSGMQKALIDQIDSAQSSLDVMMYQLSVQAFVDAFIAAKNRGVAVRVMLDADQYVNDSSGTKLKGAGIEVKNAPAEFEHAHAKTMVIDKNKAVIDSGNFNQYSMQSERNYAVVDTAADDVADLEAVFERDWSGAPLDLSCTRLIVSPENSHQRLLAHMSGAKQSLDFSIMYISDKDSLDAIKARVAAGVPVRVLLADPAWISDNTATAADLKAAGAQAKFLKSYELHAKLIVADGVPFVGSENLSWTSLESNREIGVFVTEPEPADAIKAQFEKDWAAGVNQ